MIIGPPPKFHRTRDNLGTPDACATSSLAWVCTHWCLASKTLAVPRTATHTISMNVAKPRSVCQWQNRT